VPLQVVIGQTITQNEVKLDGRVIKIVGGQQVGETELHQPVVTFDDQGNLIESGDGGVARLRAVKNGKRGETWWERLDPETGEVWDRRVMRDGDEESLGGLVRLRYETDIDDELAEGESDE
jgi:hypothetical protein